MPRILRGTLQRGGGAAELDTQDHSITDSLEPEPQSSRAGHPAPQHQRLTGAGTTEQQSRTPRATASQTHWSQNHRAAEPDTPRHSIRDSLEPEPQSSRAGHPAPQHHRLTGAGTTEQQSRTPRATASQTHWSRNHRAAEPDTPRHSITDSLEPEPQTSGA
ncbi:hypothetical protein NDU88_000187 [Pleurodeles waltl]|uniref:Uncharacterized protein n=1 Tax=Pleurodeles waltl TaxID=8319 RepID=A0AAV7U3I1_PLEWA|nr:hypothetical protein NDU88_000187 [Pleurodeles waltl]